MAAISITDQWTEARAALEVVVPRVTALMRSVRNPTAPALARWSVAEVATHLTQAWEEVPRLAMRQPGMLGQRFLPLAHMMDFADVTTAAVADEPERDLSVLAGRIETGAAAFLRACETARADEHNPWLVDGAEVSRATFCCHLLNESLVHGYDIARADGQPWEIDRRHATLIILGFLLPIMATLDSRTFANPEKAAGVRACFEIRLRGSSQRFYMVFDDGAIAASTDRPARPVDCHLSVDPVAFLLVAWNRISQWGPIAKGQMLVWGRRPWLGPQVRSMLRTA